MFFSVSVLKPKMGIKVVKKCRKNYLYNVSNTFLYEAWLPVEKVPCVKFHRNKTK